MAARAFRASRLLFDVGFGTADARPSRLEITRLAHEVTLTARGVAAHQREVVNCIPAASHTGEVGHSPVAAQEETVAARPRVVTDRSLGVGHSRGAMDRRRPAARNKVVAGCTSGASIWGAHRRTAGVRNRHVADRSCAAADGGVAVHRRKAAARAAEGSCPALPRDRKAPPRLAAPPMWQSRYIGEGAWYPLLPPPTEINTKLSRLFRSYVSITPD
jgi:hypothetical protein